ncbi:MAG: ATP-dependent helicase [Selenomonadaceae bacterium]|nr:ATP-dependent helicase [Selenomonadaceae bacterium]
MIDKINFALTTDFLSSLSKLPDTIQGKVWGFVKKLHNNSLLLKIVEKVNGAVDKKMRCVSVDDSYSIIFVCEDSTNLYMPAWVDDKSAAYAWAQKKYCSVNPQKNVLQIFEWTDSNLPIPKNSLLKNISDKDLLAIGVPEQQLSLVRTIVDAESFNLVTALLPKDVYECLMWLLVEKMPLPEVLDYAKSQSGDKAVTTIKEAIENPVSRDSFYVVEGEDELKKIMSAPLEKWRVFLHHTQREIVNRNYSGSARVTGGAGTGKTVVAMHRAKMLAAKLKDNEKILFTTFTANLVEDIKENLSKICTDKELDRIEVIHLDAWVNKFLKQSGFDREINYDAIEDIWDKAVNSVNVNLPFAASFYENEWNRVIMPQEVLTAQEYSKASRIGLGTPLNLKKRLLVWKVIEAYRGLLEKNKICDINTAMYTCRKILEGNKTVPPYKHIIVDEGQDFSDNAYRLLRALAGAEHANDLFIVGDGNQRIYRNRPTLSNCGINIRGRRSSILKINYRTTEEIRKYAVTQILKGATPDDLEDKNINYDSISLTHGSSPQCKNFSDFNEEFKFIRSEINKLKNSGVALSSICIVARTAKLVDEYEKHLNAAGINSVKIKRSNYDDPSIEGVRIATMHRVKGLEFKYVFIASANNKIIPLTSVTETFDDVSRAEALTSERCLLYVAITRAQKEVYITSYGEPSRFLRED